MSLKVNNCNTKFSNKYSENEIINIPIAHNEANFFANEDTVLSAIRSDAVIKGVPESYLIEVFSNDGITIHNKILDRFARPYEKKSWVDYRKLFVTESRISKGTDFYRENEAILISVGKMTGVNPFLILSIVGVESNYGRHKGEFTVFNACLLYTSPRPRD